MIDEKKLTKEECLKATKELKDSFLLHTPRYISFHSPRIMKHISNLEKLINKHFDNPPLKFDELEKGMWIWDNKNKCWLYLFKPLDWEPIKGLRYAERIIEHSTEGYYMDFEKGRFYRKQVD